MKEICFPTTRWKNFRENNVLVNRIIFKLQSNLSHLLYNNIESVLFEKGILLLKKLR